MRLFRGREPEGTDNDLPPGPVSESRPWFAGRARSARHEAPATRATSLRLDDDRDTGRHGRRPAAAPVESDEQRPQPKRGKAKAKQPASWGWEYLPKPIRPKNAGIDQPKPKAKAPYSLGLDSATKAKGRTSGRGDGWFTAIDGSGRKGGGWGRLY